MTGAFTVVSGSAAQQALEDRQSVLGIVREAYAAHRAGATDLPDSFFLRFQDRPRDRIIALPCRLAGNPDIAGVKWISSFPGNLDQSLPRASAVVILNDMDTGRPFACLEGSRISAARTAASAAMSLESLQSTHQSDSRVAFIGAGVIAHEIARYLDAVDVAVKEVVVCDPCIQSAEAFVLHAETLGWACNRGSMNDALTCGTVIAATTATAPHITRSPRAGQVYLNVSLRDFAPEVILASQNLLDDVDHCLKADTSPHLAERLSGNRDFVTGTIPDVLAADLELDSDSGVVVSPFGLGVLDLAVAEWVLRQTQESEGHIVIPDFFPHRYEPS